MKVRFFLYRFFFSFSTMFSLFALFHTRKTRLHIYYGSARPFPESDLISFSESESEGWKLELSFSEDLCSVLIFICFSFYILDFLLNFPFSHTDKLICMPGRWRGCPPGMRGGCCHGETPAVSGRGGEVRLVRLQLLNAVGNGHEEMAYVLLCYLSAW